MTKQSFYKRILRKARSVRNAAAIGRPKPLKKRLRSMRSDLVLGAGIGVTGTLGIGAATLARNAATRDRLLPKELL